MNKVWVVEEGEYSAYHIEGIFSTEDKAHAFASHVDGSAVVEWDLDQWIPQRSEFRIVFGLNGEINRVTEKPYLEKEKEDAPVYAQAWGGGILIVVQRGPLELAKKIASERYLKIRAHYDQARELAESRLASEVPHLRDHATVMVAEVLAGTKPLPNPPGTGFERMVMTCLESVK